jgi:hypothetical protein
LVAEVTIVDSNRAALIDSENIREKEMTKIIRILLFFFLKDATAGLIYIV